VSESPSRAIDDEGIQAVKGQLATLHANGYIHGDVRYANIVWNGAASRLIDFDYARQISTEPHYVSMYVTEGIPERHPCAAAGHLMEAEHDNEAIERIEKCKDEITGMAVAHTGTPEKNKVEMVVNC